MAFDNVRCNSFNAINVGFTQAQQFIFVELDTSGGIIPATQGALAIGVLQDTPPQGDPGAVCMPGNVTKVLCSATVTAGQFVSSDANGNAVPATSGAHFLGQAIQGAGAGSLAVILFQPSGAKS